MSDASTDLAAIDANLVKGEWWLCVLNELMQIGFAMTKGFMHGVKGDGASLAGRCLSVVDDFCRFAGAIHKVIALSQRLEQALRGLRALRDCTAEEIAAARAKAEIEAEKLAARRARAREAAKARREAREEAGSEEPRSEGVARENIGERVTAAKDFGVSFEPAYVDLDALELRRLVERICADLRITPPWDRWQAEEWLPRNPEPDIVATPPGELSPSHPAGRLSGDPPRDPRARRVDDALGRHAGIATLDTPRAQLE